jgi:hypothetical protein
MEKTHEVLALAVFLAASVPLLIAVLMMSA